MNIYLIGHKLYISWFVLIDVLGLFIFIQTNLFLTVVAQIFILPAMFSLAQISARKYGYFFRNHGISQASIFCKIAAMHLVALMVSTEVIMRVFNA